MNAFEPSRPPLQPVEPPRKASRKSRPLRRHSYQGFAAETTAKLVVNVVLSSAAIAALTQLLPYHLSQRAKLQEIRSEVKRTEKRVDRLHSDFSRHFDPQKAKTVMQEQSYRVDPTQRSVFLVKDAPEEEATPRP